MKKPAILFGPICLFVTECFCAEKPVCDLRFNGNTNASGTLQPAATEIVGAAPVFVAGLEGKALVIQDEPTRGVKFLFDKGFPATGGSISLWVHLVDWAYDDEKFHVFLEAAFYPADVQAGEMSKDNPLSRYLLYKYAKPYASGSALLLAYDDNRKNRWILGQKYTEMGGWKRGTWHHLVIVWDKTARDACTMFFVDGMMSGVTNSQWDRFDYSGRVLLTFGASWGSEGKTAVDHVSIYDRPLSPDEINDMYSDGMDVVAVEK